MTFPSVLFVGADAERRDAAARVLAHDGYATVQAACGREALGIARECRPAVVLLEYVLPDFDFCEALAQLRGAVEPGVVRVVLVVPPDIALDRLASALNVGADGCLVRPVSDDDLLARVRALFPPPGDLLKADAGSPDAAQDCASEQRYRDIVHHSSDLPMTVPMTVPDGALLTFEGAH